MESSNPEPVDSKTARRASWTLYAVAAGLTGITVMWAMATLFMLYADVGGILSNTWPDVIMESLATTISVASGVMVLIGAAGFLGVVFGRTPRGPIHKNQWRLRSGILMVIAGKGFTALIPDDYQGLQFAFTGLLGVVLLLGGIAIAVTGWLGIATGWARLAGSPLIHRLGVWVEWCVAVLVGSSLAILLLTPVTFVFQLPEAIIIMIFVSMALMVGAITLVSVAHWIAAQAVRTCGRANQPLAI